jgi:hypothetical protein
MLPSARRQLVSKLCGRRRWPGEFPQVQPAIHVQTGLEVDQRAIDHSPDE